MAFEDFLIYKFPLFTLENHMDGNTFYVDLNRGYLTFLYFTYLKNIGTTRNFFSHYYTGIFISFAIQ